MEARVGDYTERYQARQELLPHQQFLIMKLFTGFYILKDKTPVEAQTLEEWATWWGINVPMYVAKDVMNNGTRISTVFLSVPSYLGDSFSGPPYLFETAVFNSDEDTEIVNRYKTWEEAEKGHQKVLAELTEAK